VYDDIGDQLTLTRSAERVVSLVPSLTEAIASTGRGLLVGATNWCTHPSDLDVARVRGTKNPDVDAVVALRPDVVIANAEENRDEDIRRLREHGVAVWVTAPTTVPEALTSLGRMYDMLMIDRPPWLEHAEQEWAPPPPPPSRQAVVPVWRRPWMALGRDTFAGDVLARLGVRNVLDGDPERYPRIDLGRLPAHDLVVLPDEPYAFSQTDGPEAFPAVPSACVSGRHLTWYGPSLVEARGLLTAQLGAARMAR
jgi:ABC-type Fe3+-hydroxamate transport system substrate-binding protein